MGYIILFSAIVLGGVAGGVAVQSWQRDQVDTSPKLTEIRVKFCWSLGGTAILRHDQTYVGCEIPAPADATAPTAEGRL